MGRRQCYFEKRLLLREESSIRKRDLCQVKQILLEEGTSIKGESPILKRD